MGFLKSIFFCFILIYFFKNSASAQLYDIYSDLSKKSFELIEGSCEDRSQTEYLSPCNKTLHPLEQSLDFREEAFFQQQGENWLSRLKCEKKKLDILDKDSDFKKWILTDYAKKISLGTQIKKEIQNKVAMRTRLLGGAFMNFQSEILRINEEIEKLNDSLKAVITSSWNGDSESVSQFLLKEMAKGVIDTSLIEKTIQGALVFLDLNNEWQSKITELEKQKNKNGYWSLNPETKKQIWSVYKNEDLEWDKKEPSSLSGFQCHLEGKYGKGQDYLDNLLMGASVVGGLGSLAIKKAPVLFRATLSKGSRMGLVTQRASQVTLRLSLGLTGTQFINEIDRHCLQDRQSSTVSKKSCDLSPDLLKASEVISLTQGNCILTVAATMGAGGLALVAGAAKVTKNLLIYDPKTKSTWEALANKRLGYYNMRINEKLKVNQTQVSQLDKREKDLVKKMGGEIEALPLQSSQVQEAKAALLKRRQEIEVELDSIRKKNKSGSLSATEQSRIHIWDEQITKLKSQMDKVDSEIKSIQNDKEAIQSKYKNLLSKNISISERESLIKIEKSELDEIDKKMTRLKGQQKELQLKLSEAEYSKKQIQKNNNSAADDKINELQSELKELDEDLNFVESYYNSPKSEVMREIQSGTVYSDKPGETITAYLYEIKKLPTRKGPRDPRGPVLLHPDFSKDLELARQLGYEVRLDPSLELTRSLARANPITKTIHINADTPYHIFRHELEHARFDRYVLSKDISLREQAMESKEFVNLFSSQEVRDYGINRIRRLEDLLKKQNTSLAINERMAVDEQLRVLGFRKLATRDYLINIEYGLAHEGLGYQMLLQANKKLNSVQEEEYKKTVKRLGMLIQIIDGQGAASRFLNQVSVPSLQGALLIKRTMDEYSNKPLEELNVLYDESGNLIYKRSDGVWERSKMTSNN